MADYGALWVDPVTGLSIGGVPVGPSGRPRIQIGNTSPVATEEVPSFGSIGVPPPQQPGQPLSLASPAASLTAEEREAAALQPEWNADPRNLFQRVMGEFNPAQEAAPQPAADPRSLGQKLMGEFGTREQLWPEKMIRSAASLPGDVASGEVPQWQRDPSTGEFHTSAPMIERAQDTAGVAVLGGMPMAERGALGMFGGRLAKNADLQALGRAQKMTAEGAPPSQIWEKTGWFTGADGQWRFEIPDQNANFKRIETKHSIDNFPIDIERTYPTGEAFLHPELYAAYPDLAQIPLEVKPQGSAYGSYQRPGVSGRDETIGITQFDTRYSPNKEKARSVMLHELQHAVQQREGFAPGSSPSIAAREVYDAINPQLSRLASEMDKLPLNSPERAVLKREYDALMDRRHSADPDDLYRRTSGEVEARNVQTRMDWDDAQRADIPPQYSQQFPYDEQIVRKNEAAQQSSAPGWMRDILDNAARRKATAENLAAGNNSLRMMHPDGRYAVAGPDMSNGGMFRLTRFDADGPVGHTEHKTLAEAIDEGLRSKYQPAPAPSTDYMKMLDLGDNAPLSSPPIQRMVSEGAPDATSARPTAAAERAGPGAESGGRGRAGSGNRSLAEAQAEAARAAGADAPLEGLPQKPIILNGDYYVPGPIASIRNVARDYMASTGREYNPPTKYHPVDPEHAAAVAKAFEEMPHAPNDPAVKASYKALIDETLAQYQAMKAAGVKVDPIPADMPDPYAANPRLAAKDVADNNHLWFFPTDQGFGSGGAAGANHPMLRKTGERLGDHELVANDVFRIVHDYFGHLKEGVGFRAAGEDNAFRIHSSMYSDLARPAMTTETRGQNSWVNYGPHGAKNRTANAADTIYADQKVGIMPEWTTRDAGSAEPIVAYHGTPHDIGKFDMSKIGTGEGSQAYGHGLYFAENERVAKSYRDQLAVWQDRDLLAKHGLDPEDGAYVGRIVARANGDTGQAYLNVTKAIKEIKDEMAAGRGWAASDRAAVERLEKTASYILDAQRAKGHTYQVALDIHPDHVLDYDAPMSQQTPYVRERLAPIIEERRAAQQAALKLQEERGKSTKHVKIIDPETTTGARAYEFAGLPAKDRPEGIVKSSNRLREAGIPALRYKANGIDGQGTSNMVVLDDRLIRILKKYGLVGGAGGTLFSAGQDQEK